MRVIDVCSGKGGVGKTTVILNLAFALRELNKRVCVIDTNFTTSHFQIFLDFDYNFTLNDFLLGKVGLEQVVYDYFNVKILPSSLLLEDLVDINPFELKEKLQPLFSNFDYVLVDSAPGFGKEALISLNLSNEVIFVTNPTIPSVIDTYKAIKLARSLNLKTLGIVLNQVKGKKYEITEKEVLQITSLPVIAKIAYDEKFVECLNKRKPYFLTYKKSKNSKSFLRLAYWLEGIPFKQRFSFFGFLKRRKEFNYL